MATLTGTKRKQNIDVDQDASINRLIDPMKIGTFGYLGIDETNKEYSLQVYNADAADFLTNMLIGDQYLGIPNLDLDTTRLKVRRYSDNSDGGDIIPGTNKYFRWEWYHAGADAPSITIYDGRWGPGDTGGYVWNTGTFIDISDLTSVIDGTIELTGSLKIIDAADPTRYYNMAGDQFKVNATGAYTVQDPYSFYFSWTSGDFPGKIFYTDEGGSIPLNTAGYIWNFYSRLRQYSDETTAMDLYSFKSYLYIANSANPSSAYSYDAYVKNTGAGSVIAFQGEVHGSSTGLGTGLKITADTPNDGTLYGLHISALPTDTTSAITGTILGGFFENGDVKINDHLILGDSGATKDGYIDLPTGKLHIGGYLEVLYNNTSGGILIRNQDTSNATSMSWMSDDLQSELTIGVNNSAATTDPHAAYIWQVYAYDLKFGTNNTERMRITSAGQVQIADSLTIAGYTAWHAGNDGPDSGLNADLLDGEEGSYYANTALSNVADSTVLNKVLNVDGPGSGLNADYLDSHDSTHFLSSVLRGIATTDMIVDPRYNTGYITQLFYSHNWLCYADDLHGATIEFTDDTYNAATGISYPERVFVTDGSDSYSVLDMTVTPDPMYITITAPFPTTTSPGGIRLMLIWHGSRAYENLVFEVVAKDGTTVEVPVWKVVSGIYYVSEHITDYLPYSSTTWPIQKVRAKLSTKSTTTSNRYLYAIMYWAPRSDAFPYLLNKKGDTMVGDFTAKSNIINQDVLKPVITVDDTDNTAVTIIVSARQINGTVSARIGSDVRAAIHYYISDSAFGNITAPTSSGTITYTVNLGNNLTPDSPDPAAMNYAVTDLNGYFKITINVSATGDNKTYYFHCEIDGKMYYAAFNISDGQGG